MYRKVSPQFSIGTVISERASENCGVTYLNKPGLVLSRPGATHMSPKVLQCCYQDLDALKRQVLFITLRELPVISIVGNRLTWETP